MSKENRSPQEIEREVTRTLETLPFGERPEASPFFYSRLRQRMESETGTDIKPSRSRFVYYLAAASAAILLGFGIGNLAPSQNGTAGNTSSLNLETEFLGESLTDQSSALYLTLY